jgi:adenylate cyclase
MAVEIERKFLVKDDSWRREATAERIRQGYLCSFEDRAVRARIVGNRAFLTIKGAKNGVSRFEYEYQIPVEDAAEMLDRLCEWPLIEKTRHHVTVDGREWVIDVFEGDNVGLVVAEVELVDEMQVIEVPAWAGEEVSDDPRYFNVNLAKHPYRLWMPTDAQLRLGHP